MCRKKLIVRLKGGLGNQMFQYAFGRSLALKNDMRLKIDAVTGFALDKVCRRNFSMSIFPITTDFANLCEQLPFWFETALNRFLPGFQNLIRHRPWGLYMYDTNRRYHKEIAEFDFQKNVAKNIFMDGFWQSEHYFNDYGELLRKEFSLPVPRDDLSLSMAKKIERCDSVSVGVRLFEEVPGASQQGLGGLVPFSFYEDGAIRIADKIKNPTFFVFCTKEDGVRGKLCLPGNVYYVTHDNGYKGEMKRLWLISRCAHHILSNSTFYWWGAWLAEHKQSEQLIIASDQFVNSDCIPLRWLSIPTKMSS